MTKDYLKLTLKNLATEGLEETASPVDLSLEIFDRWQKDGHLVERQYILPFIAINSNCDHLPTSKTESLWEVEALKRKLKEKQECNSFYLKDFQKACANLRQQLED